jgi:hypothetical protein
MHSRSIETVVRLDGLEQRVEQRKAVAGGKSEKRRSIRDDQHQDT